MFGILWFCGKHIPASPLHLELNGLVLFVQAPLRLVHYGKKITRRKFELFGDR